MCPWDYLAAHQMVEPQFALESRRIGDTFHARGFGGQWINVFSDLDLVIVSTANSQVDNAGDVAQEKAIDAMIRDQILPALDIIQVEGE